MIYFNFYDIVSVQRENIIKTFYMWGNNESLNPVDIQETWWMKSSTFETQKIVEDTQEKTHKLVKIHTFLESIDDSKEDQYKETLLKLDKDSLNVLLKKPQTEILDLLQKSDTQIKSILIQAQIDELKAKGFRNLSREEKIKYGSLKKEFIAVEKQETTHNDELIATKDVEINKENQIQVEKLKDQNIKIAQLRGVLLWTSEISDNRKIKEIEKKFDDIKWTDSQKERQVILDEIMEILKTPWTLESVAKDLGWVGSEEYVEFKSKMLQFEPSLQEDFDRVEMNVIWNIAKLKLWTSDLEGVDLDKNILSREEDGVVTSYSDKKGRYLSSVWGDFSLKSELNPDNEKKLGEVNSRVSEDLEPLNESLNLVNKILEYLRKAEQNGEDFEEVKMMIKTKNPDFYADEWLDNITSLNEMIMILNARKYELEEEKEDLKQEAKEKIARIIQESEKEAEQKDKMKKDTLKFLHSIGFDMFANSDVDWIIRQINISKWRFGLSEDIDLAKWNLGTVYGWENNVEKKNFARIVNILFSGKSSS